MKLNNKYYILRHGQSLSNVMGIVSSWPEKFDNPLTKKGKQEIEKAAEYLKDKNIDLIFSSDLLRTRQTADIVANSLGVKPEFDIRLREINFGSMNEKPIKEWYDYFSTEEEKIAKSPGGAENYQDVSKRMHDFLKELDEKFSKKNILIISHQSPLSLLEWQVEGLSIAEGIKEFPEKTGRIKNGEVRELN